MRNISKAKFTFYPQEWDSVSEEAKEFIRKLLVVNPSQRMTAAECLEHSWLKKDSTATVNLSGVIKGITGAGKRCRHEEVKVKVKVMISS